MCVIIFTEMNSVYLPVIIVDLMYSIVLRQKMLGLPAASGFMGEKRTVIKKLLASYSRLL